MNLKVMKASVVRVDVLPLVVVRLKEGLFKNSAIVVFVGQQISIVLIDVGELKDISLIDLVHELSVVNFLEIAIPSVTSVGVDIVLNKTSTKKRKRSKHDKISLFFRFS